MKKLVSNSRGSVWLSFCRRKCGWALQCFCLGKSLAFIQIFSFYASHYKQFWEYELQGKTMKAQMENKSPISVLFLQGSFHSPIVSCLFSFPHICGCLHQDAFCIPPFKFSPEGVIYDDNRCCPAPEFYNRRILSGS